MRSPGNDLQAVLFDRDGTLVVDVPYNGDPDLVTLMPGAREAIDAVRAAGLRVGMVTNQSGIARGLITRGQADAVNARVQELLGAFDLVLLCPHGSDDGCECRKPQPGMVLEACRTWGVDPSTVAVVGDIAADMGAARNAGARGVLVPTPVTREEEVAEAELVAPTILDAVHLLIHDPAPRRVLVVRLDSVGDVLISGPAVRAVAADPRVEVHLLCGPRGASAGRLLPGVHAVHVWDAPWISSPAPAADAASVDALHAILAEVDADEAVILTSFHQSPLPLALLLRLAGVGRITGASVDYAGSLLDVRLKPGEDLDEDQPEPERALRIAAAAGHALPADDDGRLAVLPAELPSDVDALLPEGPFALVHPGAAVGARSYPADQHRDAVALLAERGIPVVVTGGPDERDLTAHVAGPTALDLGGRTDLAGLGALMRRAAVLVSGNTGPAHLAAAVGLPVVSLFSPVVPPIRWAPYRVPVILLGDQDAPCKLSRARDCPVTGHPCLAGVPPAEVADAVERLLATTGGTGGTAARSTSEVPA
jgi:histidinol-phosphate phosphatase family protein